MGAPHELQHLLNVLGERDVSLGRDDVAWAFEGSTQYEAQSWVQEYLSPASLLTKEELMFHERQLQIPTKDYSIFSGRPLSETDFEAAIASLEASTAAISKQCQLMEAQKDALQALKARHSNDQQADQAHAQRQRRLARESAQLEFEVNELAGSLQSQVRASSKQTDAAVTALPNSVERVFEKDDRLLDGLQKLLPKLADAGPDEDVEAEVERLCQGLVVFTSQEVRARLDTAYQAAASQHPSRGNGHESARAKQVASLLAELDELTGEIDGLATMAVDSQYRLPIMRELKSGRTDSELDKERWGDYMLATLQYLSSRLEALDDHCQDLHAHQGALKSVTTAVSSVLATPPSSNPNQPTRSPATPTARGLKPLRLVQANLSEDPTSQLLRHFDIRTADPTDTAKLTATVERAVHERQLRLSELGGSTERTISDKLAETLRKADRDVQDLLGAVYAHSPYDTVRLVDAGVQAELEGLEEKTQRLGEQMRSLDVDGMASNARNR